jgi:hypothetical protein
MRNGTIAQDRYLGVPAELADPEGAPFPEIAWSAASSGSRPGWTCRVCAASWPGQATIDSATVARMGQTGCLASGQANTGGLSVKAHDVSWIVVREGYGP